MFAMDKVKQDKGSLSLPVLEGARFLLTGAPGAGKTTVIDLLSSQGVQVVSEAYTTLFNEAMAAGESAAEFFRDPLRLRRRLYEKQCAMEAGVDSSRLTFLDRGTPDICFFGELFGVAMPDDFCRLMLERSYDGVLMLDLVPEECFQQTQVRQETYEQTMRVHEYFKKRIGECRYWVARIPFMSPEKRVEYVFSLVNQAYIYSTIIDCFAGKNDRYEIKPYFGPIRLIEIASVKGAPYRFYGVHIDAQNDVDFSTLRKRVLAFASTEVQSIVQVVGDSGPKSFDEAGTAYGRDFLREFFEQPVLIEYGFTGNRFDTHLGVCRKTN